MISILYTTATILFSAMVGLFFSFALFITDKIKFVNIGINFVDKYIKNTLISVLLFMGLIFVAVSTLFYVIFFTKLI